MFIRLLSVLCKAKHVTYRPSESPLLFYRPVNSKSRSHWYSWSQAGIRTRYPQILTRRGITVLTRPVAYTGQTNVLGYSYVAVSR